MVLTMGIIISIDYVVWMSDIIEVTALSIFIFDEFLVAIERVSKTNHPRELVLETDRDAGSDSCTKAFSTDE